MESFLFKWARTYVIPGKRTAGLVRRLPQRALQNADWSTAAATFSNNVFVLRDKIRQFKKEKIYCQTVKNKLLFSSRMYESIHIIVICFTQETSVIAWKEHVLYKSEDWILSPVSTIYQLCNLGNHLIHLQFSFFIYKIKVTTKTISQVLSISVGC